MCHTSVADVWHMICKGESNGGICIANECEKGTLT
jgi:hypothetical protein